MKSIRNGFSVKRRLIVTLTALLLPMGLLNIVATYQLSVDHIHEILDARLEEIARYVNDDITQFETAPAANHEDARTVIVQITKGTRSLSTDPNVRFDAHLTNGFSDVTRDGVLWRIYTLHSQQETVQVAQRPVLRKQILRRALLTASIQVALLLPLSWIVIAYSVKRSLRPLDSLGAMAAKAAALNNAPLDAPDIPIELRPFIDSINHMVHRISALVDAEKQFISDAAHELRTPIAALQIQAENLQHRPDAERLLALHQGIARTSALVNQLLRLARADPQLNVGQTEAVELDGLVTELIGEFLLITGMRSIDLGVDNLVPARVAGSRSDLRLVVRNLIENAVRYSPDGAKVDIDVGVDNEQGWVRVCDNGPGIPDAALPRVFDRFFRAASDVEGSGLGLSIVQSLVMRHDGSVKLENRTDGISGLIATVSFPIAPASP